MPSAASSSPVSAVTESKPEQRGRWSRWRDRRWVPEPVAAVVVAATAVFALAGIGGPLLGLSVFADTGSLRDYSGYQDVLPGAQVQNNYVRDLVDSAMPNSILFGEALRSGDFAAWNPYALGGGPLGSNPNAAVASPLSAPWWVLPGWLAPGYVKLLEIICAVGGTFLFLRRLRLRAAAAWLGGLVFASSAFMVTWTGWPQTRVAALIPALFWALERLAQRVRPREVVLVSLPVAGMLLGGFPAVVGYTLLTAGGYLLVRLIGEHWQGFGLRAARRAWRLVAWRPVVGRLAAAGAGMAAGVGLAAWQLVPWAQFMGNAYVVGRAQTPDDHIPSSALLTMIAPYAFGTTNPAHPPDWFGSLELIDAESYVGAAALVLVVTAIALAGPARRLLPRGVWWLFIGAAAFWLTAIYAGGPLLSGLQSLPVLFSQNFVGRARSVLGFVFAVLAAVGFEALLRGRRRCAPATTRRWWRWGYGYAVWGGLAVAGAAVYAAGADRADALTAKRTPGTPGPDYLSYLHGQVAVGLAIVVVAGSCAVWLWWRPRTLRLSALWAPAGSPQARAWSPATRRRVLLVVAAALPVLIAAQSLAWVRTFYPRTDREAFYPSNPTQQFLAANLGHERYFGADGAIFGSVDATVPLRGYDGHAFIDQGYAELADSLPGEQFHTPTTTIMSDPLYANSVAVNPVLDRAAVRYFVVGPEVTPFGQVRQTPDDGGVVDLEPGNSVTVALHTGNDGLRGVGIVPAAAPDASPTGPFTQVADAAQAESDDTSAHLEITVRDQAGQVLVTGERLSSSRSTDRLVGGSPWVVPLAGEDIPAGADLTAEITELGPTPLRVSTAGGVPALTTVDAVSDGLRLVYAHESVIYERTRALPRARWATSSTVASDPANAVKMITTAATPPDTVILDAPGPAASGQPGTVDWLNDGLNSMALRVRADGAGYLVLADAIQHGWSATVDGVAAPIRPADRAFAAVAVPAGDHVIRFVYTEPFAGPGTYLTGATALLLLAILAAEYWWRRRTSRTQVVAAA